MKIEAQFLSKKFDDLVVIENFNLEVLSGEMVSILGQSGSGKTTLINMIVLIEEYDTGKIFYNNNLIIKKSEKRRLLREQIGFIFQNYELIDNETVYENLKLVSQVKRKKKQERLALMIHALNEVGLSEGLLHKKVFTCSGDEQQRIAIAKIPLKETSVIFADEPTASLDDDNKQNILYHLKKLQASGKTIVIVSHDRSICHSCDRVITL